MNIKEKTQRLRKQKTEGKKKIIALTSTYSLKSHLMQESKIANDELTRGIIEEKDP